MRFYDKMGAKTIKNLKTHFLKIKFFKQKKH